MIGDYAEKCKKNKYAKYNSSYSQNIYSRQIPHSIRHNSNLIYCTYERINPLFIL